jgi:hypothetical protein
VVLHREDADRHGVVLSGDRKNEATSRYVAKILEHITDLRSGSLVEARPPAARFAGVCRDFAILTTSILRYHRAPARLRCGFAAYFTPGFYEDHWVGEYWKPGTGWTLVDAELGDDQVEKNDITFDPLDIPRDQFVVGGDAWARCRSGKDVGEHFGVGVIALSGTWFVANDVVRDLAAVNSVEVLPWDEWGVAEKPFDHLSVSELHLFDEVAQLEIWGGSLSEIQALFNGHSELRVPDAVRSHTTYGGVHLVSL